nr:MAG TPA: hypothetical protein [Caudoviricetes sp.]
MLDLYIKYREETPYQYRYGDESEVMRLFIDGGGLYAGGSKESVGTRTK